MGLTNNEGEGGTCLLESFLINLFSMFEKFSPPYVVVFFLSLPVWACSMTAIDQYNSLAGRLIIIEAPPTDFPLTLI